jgi:hypothetical protein
MNDDKARKRQLKREVKKAGGRRRRRQLGRLLAEDPEGAAHHEAGFGRNASAPHNGMDDDRTRRRAPARDGRPPRPEAEDPGP